MDIISGLLRRSKIFEATDKWLVKRTNPTKTILISGFWRSGTTLLMQAVSTIFHLRSIYEPLHRYVKERNQFLDSQSIRQTQWLPFWSDYMNDQTFIGLQKKILRADISGEWVRRHRRFQEMAAQPLLVKMVRSNLCLPFYQKRFNTKSILLIRHPGAVLSSLLRVKGSADTIRQNIAQRSLVESVFDKFKTDFPSVDKMKEHFSDEWSRIILLYLIMNEYPLRWQEQEIIDPLVLTYEQMIRDPLQVSNRIKSFVERNFQIPKNNLIGVWRNPSGTTKKVRKNITIDQRLNSWKNDLDPGVQERLYRLLQIPAFKNMRLLVGQMDQRTKQI